MGSRLGSGLGCLWLGCLWRSTFALVLLTTYYSLTRGNTLALARARGAALQ